MAIESVARIGELDPPEAITQWCDDIGWEKLEGKIPSGAWRRLMRINRCVHAMNQIQEMLFSDQLGKADKEDSGASFQGLAPIDAQALAIGAMELGARAEKILDELRDGRFT